MFNMTNESALEVHLKLFFKRQIVGGSLISIGKSSPTLRAVKTFSYALYYSRNIQEYSLRYLVAV